MTSSRRPARAGPARGCVCLDQVGLMNPISSSITAFGPIGIHPGFGRLSL